MKIYVWGTGRLTGKVIGTYLEPSKVEAYVDNDPRKTEWQGKPVLRPEELLTKDYDAVIVINLHSMEIHEQCKELGIDPNKLIFLYQNIKKQDLNLNYPLIETIFGREYADIVQNRYRLIRAVETRDGALEGDERIQGGYFKTDYVRIKIFELVAHEINKGNIEGAVGEVGVFRGEFAQYINVAFPNRVCYLCDTFEGFDEAEAVHEIKNDNATKAFVDAYSDTSINVVMQKMLYPQNVIIKKGLFPESMKDVDEKFAFVSIDMDFEESIYQGLKFFYPKLSEGGYIFLHDYNSSLHGVKSAVERFENDVARLSKVPLCDANGTLVITK